jgi:hypothetical protein
MKTGERHPLHPLVILSGIIIVVVGTVIAAMIIDKVRLVPPIPTPVALNQTPMPNQTSITNPTSTYTVTDGICFPQTDRTPPKPTANGEWIYDCLSSGKGNWVGQSEKWKEANWKRGSGQSEIVNIVVPQGAVKMGIGCNPCTIVAPNGASLSPQCLSESECFGPFRPNASLNVSAGEVYKVQIFGVDSCPTRIGVIPPCSPEIYIWFNLP